MGRMQHEEHIFKNPDRYVLNVTLVQTILNLLTPHNSLIMIGTRNSRVSAKLKAENDFEDVHIATEQSNVSSVPIPTLDHIEPYHSTPFTLYEIPSGLLHYWSSLSQNSDLHIAGPNPYIKRKIRSSYIYPLDPILLTSIAGVKMWMASGFDGKQTMSLQCELRTRRTIKSSRREGEKQSEVVSKCELCRLVR